MPLRVFRHEIAEAALVEDDALLRKLVVGLDGGVGVDAELRRILTHAGYAVESLIDASQNFIAQPVGYLQEDGFFVIEWHSFVCFVWMNGYFCHCSFDVSMSPLPAMSLSRECRVPASVISPLPEMATLA